MSQAPLNPKNNLRLSDLTSDAAIATTDTLLYDKNSVVLPLQRARRLLVSEFITFLANLLIPTGVGLPWFGGAAPSGFLLLSGGTIGNAASGGTLRANADTAALFTLLYNNFAQTELPIQTSTGSASTRGGNAASDYASNKRLPVPDLRGRGFFGLDNIGGSTANRITSGGSGINGTTPGIAGGTESVTLLAANLPVTQNATNDVGAGSALKSAITQSATAISKMPPAFLGWWIVKL
jgi:hypothetical protein